MSSAWKLVRSALHLEEKESLLRLLKEVYELDRQNRDFMDARFVVNGRSESIEPYKRRIDHALSPDPLSNPNGKISVAAARKAVSDYRKASRDLAGALDLMLFYVECGTEFAAEYGFGEEPYFASLEGIFAALLKELPRLDAALRSEYWDRIDSLIERAGAIGWGYPDTLRSLLEHAPVRTKR